MRGKKTSVGFKAIKTAHLEQEVKIRGILGMVERMNCAVFELKHTFQGNVRLYINLGKI